MLSGLLPAHAPSQVFSNAFHVQPSLEPVIFIVLLQVFQRFSGRFAFSQVRPQATSKFLFPNEFLFFQVLAFLAQLK